MDLHATHLRHPLACKKCKMEFEENASYAQPSPGGAGIPKRFETFELFSRYTALRPISKGTYGYVICARDEKREEAWQNLSAAERIPDPDDGLTEDQWHDLKTLVAIKKIPQIFESGILRTWLCAAREAQMLLHFKHENVISATDLFIPLAPEHLFSEATITMRSKTFEDIYIAMEFKDFTLREVMRTHMLRNEDGSVKYCPITREPLCPLPKPYREFLLYQMLRGVGYLHKCCVMHRDLKPENVLVDVNYKCCICDLGQAKDVTMQNEGDDDVPMSQNMTYFDNCTQWYAAPETLTLIPEASGDSGCVGADVLHSVDCWSLGAIAAEMLLGRALFHTRHGGGISQLRAIMHVRGPIGEAEASALCSGRDGSVKDTIMAEMLVTDATTRAHTNFKQFLKDNCPLEDAEDDELDLIERLLSYDPQSRLTPQDALSHSFFANAGYEPTIDPDNTARPLHTVHKDQVSDAVAARSFFWRLFLSMHTDVVQLVDVLVAQEDAKAHSVAAVSKA